ncbi:unnamed protein product [Protopolystoma xenopodis]|uniref:Uncharacterized protein n=1 Tax=Protopolystoma xenopodis TaxID=117903 RepID=A0A448WWK5_9PLAT|nr:unnamed protein product [Protopolystoma xenopodis]
MRIVSHSIATGTICFINCVRQKNGPLANATEAYDLENECWRRGQYGGMHVPLSIDGPFIVAMSHADGVGWREARANV